jgi:hypothetical protein
MFWAQLLKALRDRLFRVWAPLTVSPSPFVRPLRPPADADAQAQLTLHPFRAPPPRGGGRIGEQGPSLISTDPINLLPRLKYLSSHQLLGEEMIPSISSQIALATRVDLDGQQEPAFVELQLLVSDLIEAKVSAMSRADRRKIDEGALENLARDLNEAIKEKVFMDVSKACLPKEGGDDPTLNLKQGVKALAIGTLVVPGALRILGAKINNRDAAVKEAVSVLADLTLGTGLRVGLAVATQGWSLVVNAAARRHFENAGDKLIGFLVGFVVPERATVMSTGGFKAFCEGLEEQGDVMCDRSGKSSKEQGELLKDYAAALKRYWNATALFVPDIEAAEGAKTAEASKRHRHLSIGDGARELLHLRKKQ